MIKKKTSFLNVAKKNNLPDNKGECHHKRQLQYNRKK